MSDIEVDSYPPWNFSWVVPNKLAAMAYPRNKENLKYLVDEGIKHLVTLSPEKKPPIREYPLLDWTEIPCDEFEAPTLKDIKDFVEVCRKCQAVGIHCRQGRGRTGVMLVCYFMAFQNMGPDQAITHVRLMRPGSCETYEQEKAACRYYDYLRGQGDDTEE